jgi:hypothetical protein
LGDSDNALEICFGDFDESAPSFELEEVQKFCEGTCLNYLESGAGISGSQRGAWLDDRSCLTPENSQFVREYENPLTATGLYQILNVPVRKIFSNMGSL